MAERTCIIDGCERPQLARGWCGYHYRRQQHSSAIIRKPEPTVAERFWAKVDITSDDCWIWTASVRRDGYGQIQVDGKNMAAHRYAYERLCGAIPAGLLLDHICGIRKCVNPDHLRPVTDKQNQENRRGATRKSKSGVRGVEWYPRINRWRAKVGHNGQQIHVGYFDSIEDAEAAVIAKRLELHTHNDQDRCAS